jgi:hypothetical protein
MQRYEAISKSFDLSSPNGRILVRRRRGSSLNFGVSACFVWPLVNLAISAGTRITDIV